MPDLNGKLVVPSIEISENLPKKEKNNGEQAGQRMVKLSERFYFEELLYTTFSFLFHKAKYYYQM